MDRAIELCAQCHGPQYRDYKAGAHGGMTGNWDLSRGPRVRNHCVDCHEAHAPRYPGTRPVLRPNDRIAPNPKEPPGHG
jgi:formate-dependent nitrite reductase cytochrome c552 subunit